MAGRAVGGDLLNQLNTLYRVGVTGDLSDGQLLERFLAARPEPAEAAFTALVDRHGPMVLWTCRQVLRDPHDTEDAFQATFLVLARKAGSVRRAESVASWLHGVARRIAVRAKASTARRKAYEQGAAEMRVSRSPDEEDHGESWPELHDEIARLPERFREPVVLCYLEGLTTEAAALRIGCPQGTVMSRLSRARDRLKRRLTRRGVAFSAGVLVANRTAGAASAAVSIVSKEAAIRAAMLVAVRGTAAGTVPAAAVAMASRELTRMCTLKLYKTVASLLAFVMLAAGGVGLTRWANGEEPKANRTEVKHLITESDRAEVKLDGRLSKTSKFQLLITVDVPGKEKLELVLEPLPDGQFTVSKGTALNKESSVTVRSTTVPIVNKHSKAFDSQDAVEFNDFIAEEQLRLHEAARTRIQDLSRQKAAILKRLKEQERLIRNQSDPAIVLNKRLFEDLQTQIEEMEPPKQPLKVYIPVVESKSLDRAGKFLVTEQLAKGFEGLTEFKVVGTPDEASFVVAGTILVASDPGSNAIRTIVIDPNPGNKARTTSSPSPVDVKTVKVTAVFAKDPDGRELQIQRFVKAVAEVLKGGK